MLLQSIKTDIFYEPLIGLPADKANVKYKLKISKIRLTRLMQYKSMNFNCIRNIFDIYLDSHIEVICRKF